MVGRILNSRYELTEKLGEGGMALAWKARDLLLGRQVTVKLMRDSLAADPEFVARFRREAQTAASLSNEHIAAVYDFGSDGGLHYIVMEYVPGEDLRHRLRREGALSTMETLEIAVQVAEALEAAHAKGLVHRDIKPGNILITADGQVKVTDFGIARADSAPDDTATDTLLGSAHYISPEQARGEPVGPQADLYSLGVVIFEAICGHPPFQASNPVAVVHKHIYDQPPSLHSLKPDVPVELEGILMRCFAKELSSRYPNARELLTYLLNLRARLLSPHAAPEAPPPPTHYLPPRPRPPRRRRRRLVLLIVAVVLALALGAWGWMFTRANANAVVVPLLVGLDLPSAQAVAEGMGLNLQEAGKDYSTNVPLGRVISQSPLPDEKAPAGATVEVMLSLGSSSFRVPDISEMTLAQARRQLEQAGLTAGKVTEEPSDTFPVGMVIGSDPPAGSDLPKGAAVTIIVSKAVPPTPPTPPNDTKTPPTPPTPPAHPDTITYTVPANPNSSALVEVVVEASDESGRRILCRAFLSPGESLPPQKLPTTRPVTIRIRVNDQVVEEKHFEQ